MHESISCQLRHPKSWDSLQLCYKHFSLMTNRLTYSRFKRLQSPKRRLDLHRLLPPGGLHGDAVNDDRRAGGDGAVREELRAGRIGGDDSLDAGQRRAVVHLHEGQVFLRADGPDPAAEFDGVADARDAAVGALTEMDGGSSWGGGRTTVSERRRRGGRRGGRSRCDAMRRDATRLESR